MEHRIYLVVMTNPEEGYLGIHAAGSSPAAASFAWGLMHDEGSLHFGLFEAGLVDEPDHGIRQICLGFITNNNRPDRVVALDSADCPHPTWQVLHPAFDFEDLSHGETPAYIKRWLAFEPWGE